LSLLGWTKVAALLPVFEVAHNKGASVQT